MFESQLQSHTLRNHFSSAAVEILHDFKRSQRTEVGLWRGCASVRLSACLPVCLASCFCVHLIRPDGKKHLPIASVQGLRLSVRSLDNISSRSGSLLITTAPEIVILTAFLRTQTHTHKHKHTRTRSFIHSLQIL